MDIHIDLSASPIDAPEITVAEDGLDFVIQLGEALAVTVSFEQLQAIHHAVAGWLGDG